MSRNLRIEAPKSLTEMVTARLEQAILDGDFGLGEAISEEALARSFGVSRTPVRDALSALQRSGLVTVVNKKGSYVFEPSADDAAALCEYRLMLESQGLRLSHARAKRDTLAAMRKSLSAMEGALTDDAIAYGRADTHFHQTFLDFCGNPYLRDAYHLASGRVAALRTHLTVHAIARRSASFDEHRRMVECFEAGQLDALVEILAVHIDRTRLIYLDALSTASTEERDKRSS